MALAFYPPSQRAAGGSDLTVQISPLGLVELADEEFEVHGPRLNRYATYWAWYLGHHWSYRQAPGDPQLTFNYTKALSDYITNFVFGKGISFESPDETSAIVPMLLQRVWQKDNPQERILWEIGNLGGVSGDVFVKVAYEEPYQDPSGRLHRGKVRIIPLNPAQCFPEFHPHDRSRMIRFKLKYRFWGTDLTGTRQVYTYTELLTEEMVQEYVNDELIDERPNSLGEIPITHIPNINLSSSPWGLSDIGDIISLNREYNEKATDISDIINYHAAPVTVITGAKASNLERGAKKVWGGLPKDAKVFNLENENSNVFSGPLEYLETIKRSMHELTGVPETALGQMQPISNTSGVALTIQFQPLMNRYSMKLLQYTPGLKSINKHILMTLALYEPETMMYDPVLAKGVEPKPGQMIMLDPNDPLTYESIVDWPAPLPLDLLVKLNEIQGKMALGLESKKGALRDLGEAMPDQKLQEIFEELLEDNLQQGALDLQKMEIALAQQIQTGMAIDPATGQPAMLLNEDVTTAGGGASSGGEGPQGPDPKSPALPGPLISPDPEVEATAIRLNNLAYGTKLVQPRNPAKPD